MKAKAKNQRRLLLILLLVLTVGFALFNTSLEIKGIARINENTWNIHWDEDSISINNTTIGTATATATVLATGPTVESIVTDDDEVVFEVNLQVPGEYFEFTIDMINEGSIDGIINEVSKSIYDAAEYNSDPDEATPLNQNDLPITFTVVYDGNSSNGFSYDVTDGNMPAIGDVIQKSGGSGDEGRLRVKVRVEYNSNAEVTEELNYMCVFKTAFQQHNSSSQYKPITIEPVSTTINSGDDAKFLIDFYGTEWNIEVTVHGGNITHYDSPIIGSDEYGEYVYEPNYSVSLPAVADVYTINFKGDVNTGSKVVYIDKTFSITVE